MKWQSLEIQKGCGFLDLHALWRRHSLHEIPENLCRLEQRPAFLLNKGRLLREHSITMSWEQRSANDERKDGMQKSTWEPGHTGSRRFKRKQEADGRQTQNPSERTLPKLKTGLRLGVKGAMNARQKWKKLYFLMICFHFRNKENNILNEFRENNKEVVYKG